MKEIIQLTGGSLATDQCRFYWRASDGNDEPQLDQHRPSYKICWVVGKTIFQPQINIRLISNASLSVYPGDTASREVRQKGHSPGTTSLPISSQVVMIANPFADNRL